MSLSTKSGKKLVILIRSDPRRSLRPCEGIRIALGLASSGHQVEVVLSDYAPLLLNESLETIIERELSLRLLETLKEIVHTFFIDERLLGGLESFKTDEFTLPISKTLLIRKISEADFFLAF